MELVCKVDRVLGGIESIDRGVGPTTARRRGCSAGALLVSMAERMPASGDFIADLDTRRGDVVGPALRAVPGIPAFPTFIGRTRRFDDGVLSGVEQAMGEPIGRWVALVPAKSKAALAAVSDRRSGSDRSRDQRSEEEGMALDYTGRRVGPLHPAVWAEAGRGPARRPRLGEVRSPSPGAGAAQTGDRARAEGLSRPIVRADSGFFDQGVAAAALINGADFAICAKRSSATWPPAWQIDEKSWQKAHGMDAALDECDYRPIGWPEGRRGVVRRVSVDRDELESDTRSRRRRTLDPNQLALLEDDEIGFAYAYSFILANLDWAVVDIESWFRLRALVEEKIGGAKLGTALRHRPSGYQAVNRTWMWSALVALNLSTWPQSLPGLDTGPQAEPMANDSGASSSPSSPASSATRIASCSGSRPTIRTGAFADGRVTLRRPKVPAAVPVIAAILPRLARRLLRDWLSFEVISLITALPDAAVGLWGTTWSRRAAFDGAYRASPPCCPCATRVPYAGQGDQESMMESINPWWCARSPRARRLSAVLTIVVSAGCGRQPSSVFARSLWMTRRGGSSPGVSSVGTCAASGPSRSRRSQAISR